MPLILRFPVGGKGLSGYGGICVNAMQLQRIISAYHTAGTGINTFFVIVELLSGHIAGNPGQFTAIAFVRTLHTGRIP